MRKLRPKDLFQKERSSFQGRRAVKLLVSSTEESTTILIIHSRVKSRVLLLMGLLYLELYESLKEKHKFLKYYFPEFFTNWEAVLIQDLILSKNANSQVRNKRLRFLWESGLLPTSMTKERATLITAGLEFEIQEVRERGHQTTYGWIRHFKDHGHLSTDIKPDYYPDSEEMESLFNESTGISEIRARIRIFLLTKGRTKFEELFPGIRIMTKDYG